jgi:hypothetical protein
LSHKLVGLIINLPDRVIEVVKKAEDVYVGWLVWNVSNNTAYSLSPLSWPRALSIWRYKCGPLISWFYHGYRNKNSQFRAHLFRDVFMNNSTVRCKNM